MPKRKAVEGLPNEVKTWLDKALLASNFSGYEMLAEALRERGYTIGKSAIHRYGQKFERRLAAIKASTEAARMIAEGAADDQDARSEAVIALVQTELFETIVNLQEAEDAESQTDRVTLLSKAAKNIATLTRASVNLKKFQVEARQRLAAEALAAAVDGAKAEGLTPEQAARVGAAVASRIQIYLPDNGR